MPRCDGNGMVCEGSGRFVELAIGEITDHRLAYVQSTPYVQDSTTDYVNVLVITGKIAMRTVAISRLFNP